MPLSDIDRLETVKLKKRVFEMRQALIPYRRIADELNISVTTVQAYYREMALILTPPETVEEIRNRDIEGYDESERTLRVAVKALTEQIDRRKEEKGYIDSRDLRLLGELEDKITNIRKNRALLVGANVPVRVEHSGKVTVTFDEDVEALTAEILGGGMLLTGPDEVMEPDNA